MHLTAASFSYWLQTMFVLEHASSSMLSTDCLAMQASIAKWLNGTQSWISLRSPMELWQVSMLRIPQCSVSAMSTQEMIVTNCTHTVVAS